MQFPPKMGTGNLTIGKWQGPKFSPESTTQRKSRRVLLMVSECRSTTCVLFGSDMVGWRWGGRKTRKDSNTLEAIAAQTLSMAA